MVSVLMVLMNTRVIVQELVRSLNKHGTLFIFTYFIILLTIYIGYSSDDCNTDINECL